MTWKTSLVDPPSMTNAERQRKFRKNNPGYYSRLRAKRLPATAPLPSPAVATPKPEVPSSPSSHVPEVDAPALTPTQPASPPRVLTQEEFDRASMAA